MDVEKFTTHLKERILLEDKVRQYVQAAQDFDDFINKENGGRIDAKAVETFSKRTLANGKDVVDRHFGLLRYGLYLNSDEIVNTVNPLIDGAEILDNLYSLTRERLGEEQANQIFGGVDRIAIGVPVVEKNRRMQILMERLAKRADQQTCKEILGNGLHDLKGVNFSKQRQLYLSCKDIDEYLQKKGENFIKFLEQLHKDHKPFFDQEITPEVIEFVRSEPLIRQGIREGNILYEVKIPYRTKEYLAARDEVEKRYYCCHCPWVRESLKNGKPNIPAFFCNCTAAWNKCSWEGIFEQRLKAEIIESVVMGDKWCKIAIYLPESAVK